MKPDPTPTDGELLRRATAGDRDAFSVLYVRYETIVAGYLVRRTRDPELAADLTAETFAAAILGAGGFRDEGHSAVGWLLGIARNLLARAWQRGQIERRARQRLGVEPVAASDVSLERVEALIDDADPSNPLLVALDSVPDAQREAIRAHVLDEQPYANCAADVSRHGFGFQAKPRSQPPTAASAGWSSQPGRCRWSRGAEAPGGVSVVGRR
jgi:RNA polymerase sigma-70 factor (ECF subfamily)